MCRWTNGLDWFFHNVRFFQKDSEHLQGYLQNWYDMRKDYEEHKGDGKFAYPMTGCYAPSPHCAPCEYGLIVVDMKNNVILDNNDYLSLPEIHGGSLIEDFAGYGVQAYARKDSEAFCFRELWVAGRFVRATDRRTGEPVDISGLSRKGMKDLLTGKFYREKSDVDFHLDMSPYAYTRYTPKHAEQGRKMKQSVLDLGLVLSDEEEKVWAEWLHQYDTPRRRRKQGGS